MTKPKVIVTPAELKAMVAIYDTLTAKALTSGQTPYPMPSSEASLNGYSFDTLAKMVRHSALNFCRVTDTYYLHPVQPQSPADFFTSTLA